eukprot:scaffold4232_cov107-Isochrysis_galbana.AAC.3
MLTSAPHASTLRRRPLHSRTIHSRRTSRRAGRHAWPRRVSRHRLAGRRRALLDPLRLCLVQEIVIVGVFPIIGTSEQVVEALRLPVLRGGTSPSLVGPLPPPPLEPAPPPRPRRPQHRPQPRAASPPLRSSNHHPRRRSTLPAPLQAEAAAAAVAAQQTTGGAAAAAGARLSDWLLMLARGMRMPRAVAVAGRHPWRDAATREEEDHTAVSGGPPPRCLSTDQACPATPSHPALQEPTGWSRRRGCLPMICAAGSPPEDGRRDRPQEPHLCCCSWKPRRCSSSPGLSLPLPARAPWT